MDRNVGLCSDCLSRIERNDYGVAAARYEGVMKKAIHSFKYGESLFLAGTFSRILEGFLAKTVPMKRIGLIVPVPLHPVKMRERGFNQASLLCGPLGKAYGIPVNTSCLVRARHTRPQSGLSRTDRLANLKGAFAVRDPRPVRGRHVLLVDDIYTTGTTMQEAAAALRKAGASAVTAVALAKGI
jgi:ComF family protein